MIIEFNDIIYKRTFEIVAKNKTLDVVVSISDEESKELSELMINIFKGVSDEGRINEILYKDKKEELEKLLIGFNMTKFQKMVLTDFENFMKGSIDEGIKKVKSL